MSIHLHRPPHKPRRRPPGLTAVLMALAVIVGLCVPAAAASTTATAATGTGTGTPTSTTEYPGLEAQYGPATGTAGGSDWTLGPVKNTIVDPDIDFSDLLPRLQQFAGSGTAAGIQWSGVIHVPTAGSYTFKWYGDNGFRMSIDGSSVIDHWVDDWNVPVTATVDLTAGEHSFQAQYFQDTGGANAQLSWAPPGQAMAVVPASAFTLPPGYVPTLTNASLSTDGTQVRMTFSKPLAAWPATATSHLSVAGFPIASAALDPTDPATLVVVLGGPLYKTWANLTIGYDGTGGADYADGSAVPLFYSGLANTSTANMTTPWASQVNPNNPLPDYPRPQMTRQQWQSLNGKWSFQGLPESTGATDVQTPPATSAHLTGSIVVPYPMESELSGVQQHYDYSFYRRTFNVPASWRVGGQRTVLDFGAVNYQTTVWVNNVQVATHTGGYLPFSVDITAALKGSGPQQITVGVSNTDAPNQPQGKQQLDPSGIFYTASSGIWQTVWMEPTPAKRLDQVVFTPNLPSAPSTANASVTVDAVSSTSAGGRVTVAITDGRRIVAVGTGTTNTRFTIPLADPHLWSPSDPYLYHATVVLTDGSIPDVVGSYFGERTVSVGAVNGVSKILLNGTPTFVDATLDQGFWPDGIYTAPTDAALKWDITETKAMGFNAIRKHIKVEPARWYYDADTTGMLVLQDMPSMNAGYTPTASDDTAFRSQLHQMVEDLRGETSIISFEPYNEGWGLDRNTVSNAVSEVKAAAAQVHADDPSRLVDAESGFNCCGSVNTDTGAGNVIDWHTYTGPADPQPDTADNRAAIDGEHGGWGLAIPVHDWDQGFINYAGAADTAQLTQKFVQTADAVRVEAQCQLSGSVYTQLTDVEGEVNGLWTYDRREPKMDMSQVAAANAKIIAAGSSAGDCGQNVVSKAGTWPLTDGTGTVAKDTSGNGDDATLSNGATWATSGPNGGGLQLNGTNQYAQTQGPLLNSAGSYTVAAWVNLSKKGAFATAVSEDGTVNSVFFLQYDSADDRFAFSNANARAVGNTGANGGSPATGTWYHIVGVRDATANTMSIYVNGTLAGTTTVSPADMATGPIAIGRAKFGAQQVDFWPGSLDGVQIFPTALTADQVSALG
ncbi:hypothetical protein ABIA35_007490 [Catenulispora sp. MAP12-49]|uniref:LamG-like jellyroll fold domain-containing protein n=1 Tax=Catenulispora sp. MAP12-49 TaxID=3156302 RepID=UPI0035164597